MIEKQYAVLDGLLIKVGDPIAAIHGTHSITFTMLLECQAGECYDLDYANGNIKCLKHLASINGAATICLTSNHIEALKENFKPLSKINKVTEL